MRRAFQLISASCLSASFFALSCAVENGVPGDGSASPGGASNTGGVGVGTNGGAATNGGTFSSAGSLPASGGSGGAGVGGSVSTAGSAGAAGSGGTGPAATGYTFDTDMQGFVATFSIPADLGKTLVWSASEGDPAAGALQLDVAFAALDQKVNAQLNFAGPTDFTGKTISARVKLASGLTTDAANPGGAKLYIKTGDAYVYAANDWTNLEVASIGTWITLSLAVDAPPYVDAAGTNNPAAVREIGVEIATSSTSADFAPAVVYIDSITY